jgi:hypothetical protein
MAEPPRIDNCTVFLECTSGIGDLLFDTLSGVTVALAARGCTPPVRVRTRWQRRDRHYDWPALIRSELFVMDSPLPVPAHHGGLHRMHLNGGAWPRSFYDEHAVAGRRPDVVIVTYPELHVPNGSCGCHKPERWMAPLAPTIPLEQWRARLDTVRRSVRVRNTSALPADIGARAVVHYRRGDRTRLDTKALALNHTLRNHTLDVFQQVDDAVLSWLRHTRLAAHLITDDPKWGALYVARLRAAGIDTSFRANGSAAVDDLAAMMAGRVIVRAALVSQFSELACVLSDVPLISFPPPSVFGPAPPLHGRCTSGPVTSSREVATWAGCRETAFNVEQLPANWTGVGRTWTHIAGKHHSVHTAGNKHHTAGKKNGRGS